MKILTVGKQTLYTKNEQLLLTEMGHKIVGGSYDCDLVICYDLLSLSWILFNDAPVILRTSNFDEKAESFCEELFKKRPFKVVRLNEFNLDKAKIPTDAIIRETVDEDIFSGWNGNTEQVLTVCPNLYNRPDVDFDVYERIVYGFKSALIGTKNVRQKEIIDSMQNSKVNFVHNSSTLSMAESMVMGMPTVCLGKHWWPNLPNYLDNGVTGYWSNNIDELHYIIGKLMNSSLDNLKNLAYNARIKGLKLFSKKGNAELWNQILKNAV